MLESFGVSLFSGGYGLVSALLPFVNAEVYAVAVGAKVGPIAAVSCALALALGQTAGKWVWYASGRKGMEHRRKRRGADEATERSKLASLAARLETRGSSAAVVLVSGSVGLPPLALVAVAAGATRMRLMDFLVCCLAGRVVRFSVVLVPLAVR